MPSRALHIKVNRQSTGNVAVAGDRSWCYVVLSLSEAAAGNCGYSVNGNTACPMDPGKSVAFLVEPEAVVKVHSDSSSQVADFSAIVTPLPFLDAIDALVRRGAKWA